MKSFLKKYITIAFIIAPFLAFAQYIPPPKEASQKPSGPIAIKIGTNPETGNTIYQEADIAEFGKGDVKPVIGENGRIMEKKGRFTNGIIPVFEFVPERKNDIPTPVKTADLIPHQSPIPKNPAFIKNVECIFESGTSVGYTCYYQGKKIGYFPQLPGNFLDGNGRKTINAPFADINWWHLATQPPEQHFLNYTNEKDRHVFVPFDMATGQPALPFYIPRFYIENFMNQLKVGGVKLPDGKSVPQSLIDMSINYGDLNATVMIGGKNKSPLGPYWKFIEFSKSAGIVKNSVSTQGLPAALILGEQGPAQLPLGPPATGGGWGTPQPTPAPSLYDRLSHGMGTIADFWGQNSLLSKGSFSFYYEKSIPLNGPITKGAASLPAHGFTADGQAFNFYFSKNGIPYAISITDIDKNRIYEATPWKMRVDPKNQSVITYDFPFTSVEEMEKYSQAHASPLFGK